MNPFVWALFTVILVRLVSPLHATESVVDFGSFTIALPRGYKDNPGRGIDSRVGDITIKGKSFKIHYDDIGWGDVSANDAPTKLSEFHKDILDSLLYYERLQDDSVSTCVTAWFHPSDAGRRNPIVTLNVLSFGASFSIQLERKAALRDAIEALRAIKVKEAQKTAR